MSKQCSTCGDLVPREGWTDRQWSKKFAPKCKRCLEPKHTTQKNLSSGDGTTCSRCHDPCPRFKGLCWQCEYNKEEEIHEAALRTEVRQKRERFALKMKAEQQEREEKGIIWVMPEGTQRFYTEEGVRYGLKDSGE